MSPRESPSTPTRGTEEPQPTVALRIAEALSRRILDGHHAPGDGLREIPLAEEFGVSRGSIREALRILERDGVVEIAPHRGASVTRLSTDELIEIYQVRAVLLGLAMSLCAARCDAGDLDWFEKRLERMRAAGRLADAAAGARHAEVSAEMALRIVERAGNGRLQRLLTQMSSQIARYTRVGLASASRRAESLATWTRVVDALRTHDAAEAERLGRKLVNDTFRFALARITGLDADVDRTARPER